MENTLRLLFPLGLVTTPGALENVARSQMIDCLARHMRVDRKKGSAPLSNAPRRDRIAVFPEKNPDGNLLICYSWLHFSMKKDPHLEQAVPEIFLPDIIHSVTQQFFPMPSGC